jgi:hypothetical protein
LAHVPIRCGLSAIDASEDLNYNMIRLESGSISAIQGIAHVKRFGKKELAVVEAGLAEAEVLLSRYYCIPGREWPAYPYDVKTLADLPEPEASSDILALVTRCEYRSRGWRGSDKQLDFYGICLQDHNILEVSERKADGISFEPLMLYILTHELVHVFRFANQPQRYFAKPQIRIAEERSVHRITSDILRLKQDPRLLPILRVYDDYPFVSSERPNRYHWWKELES